MTLFCLGCLTMVFTFPLIWTGSLKLLIRCIGLKARSLFEEQFYSYLLELLKHRHLLLALEFSKQHVFQTICATIICNQALYYHYYYYYYIIVIILLLQLLLDNKAIGNDPASQVCPSGFIAVQCIFHLR